MKKIQICHIFGSGDPPHFPPKINGFDLVIAADGGYRYVQAMGIKIDALVGDFDSLDTAIDCPGCGFEVVRLSKEKDRTDMLAALEYGLSKGYVNFHVYGGTGKRIDHTIANIQCLAFLAKNGARGYLHDKDDVITAINGEISFAPRSNGTLSVFSLCGLSEGVFLRGLKYELENARIDGSFPIGVSNEFAGKPVSIMVENGVLLVIYPEGTIIA